MKKTSKFFDFLIFIIILLFLRNLLLAFPGESAESIIKKVQGNFKKIDRIKLNFRQTFKWKLTGSEQRIDGVIYLKGMSNFRIETEDQIIISNGSLLWTYSIPNQQVIMDNVRRSSETLLPSDFLFQFPEDYNAFILLINEDEGKREYVLKLTPKSGDKFIKSIKIWIDGSSWIPGRLEYTDINGNDTIYDILRIELDPSFDGSIFTFSPPEGIEIIDIRQ